MRLKRHIAENDIHRDGSLFFVLISFVLILSLAVRLIFMDTFRWGDNYDEGIHALLAQLFAAGYEPYKDVFVSYPPLFVWSLQWPWQIGKNLESIQLVMIAYSLLGVFATGLIAYRWHNPLAGFIAALMISLSPKYLTASCQLMTEVPSIGLSILSVALAISSYTGKRKPIWLLVSGLVLCASLMLKFLSPFIGVLILIIIFISQAEFPSRPPGFTKGLIRDILIWAAGLLVPVLIALAVYDPVEMYNQVVAFRFDSRSEFMNEWRGNIESVVYFLFQENMNITLPALLGIVFVWKKRRTVGLIGLWLILALVFALFHVPLRYKHLPILIPPLAILGGIGLAQGWHYLTHNKTKGESRLEYRTIMGITILLTLSYMIGLGLQFADYRKSPALRYGADVVVEHIRRFTAPDDCVVTDYPTLAFFAGHPVPPDMSEVSATRFKSGYLTCDKVVQDITSSSCQIVAPIAKRITRFCPDFEEWAESQFLGKWSFPEDREVFLAQPLSPSEVAPANRLQETFGEELTLMGYDVDTRVEGGSQQLYLSLYWQASKPIQEDYTIFVHLRDAHNDTVVYGDHQPHNGLVSTRAFPVNRIVKDTIRVDIPPDLPENSYRLVCGLYSANTMERLPLLHDASGENALYLTPIQIPFPALNSTFP